MSFRPGRKQCEPRSHYENSEDPSAMSQKLIDRMQNVKTPRPMGKAKWLKAHWRMDLRHAEMGVGARTSGVSWYTEHCR